MKRIASVFLMGLFFLVSPFFVQASNDVNEKIDSKLEVLNDEKTLNLFDSIFSLLDSLLKEDQKEEVQCLSEGIASEIVSLVSDLVKVVDLSERDLKKFVYLCKIKEIDNEAEKTVFVEKILRNEDKTVLDKFLDELFSLLSYYLVDKLIGLIIRAHEEVEDYFACGIQKNDGERFFFNKKKKKNQKASAIFGAIASACGYTGQIINSETEKEKKEGVMNLFGTAFGLASQITAIDAQGDSDERAIQDSEFVVGLTLDFIDNFYLFLKSENKDLSAFADVTFFQELDSMTCHQTRRGWILDKLLSNKYFKKLLMEVFGCLEGFLHEKINEGVHYLYEKLVNLINNNRIEEAQNLIILITENGGVIVYVFKVIGF